MRNHRSALQLWQWLVLIVSALIIFIGVELLVHYEQQRLRADKLALQLNLADQLRSELEGELNIPSYLTIGLASYIRARNGELRDDELDSLLPGLVKQAPYIRNIGIAPNNRISYIYPLAGNEQALGVYYPDLVEQWPAIANIITEGSAKLTGPITLIQGGTAFIYRYPIFMANGRYWGIVSTVINIEPIWELMTERTARMNLPIALRSKLPDGRFSPSFYGNDALFQAGNPVLNVSIRGADWQMALPAVSMSAQGVTWLRTLLYSVGLIMLLLLSRLLLAMQRLRHNAKALGNNEKMLRSIHDSVIDGIMTIDQHGIIKTANPACYRIFAFSPGSLLGKPWTLLLAPSQQAEAIYHLGKAEQTELECEGQRADGQIFSLQLSHTELPLQQQGHTLFVLRDITERKRIERLQNDFVATVSHELRTPLTAINGTLNLAIGGALGSLTEKQHKMLLLAQQSCKQLHQLVNDLLDFEKLSSGNMRFYLKEVSVLHVVKQSVEQITSGLNRHVTVDDLSAGNSKVLADEARLRQVCINLLSNALKFSPSNTPIVIKVQRQQNHIRVSVFDQGKGVPAAFEPMLFQRFAQADNVAVREQGGTGLGLAISKEIIEKLEGEIGYQRQEQGSCFYFSLPLLPPA